MRLHRTRLCASAWALAALALGGAVLTGCGDRSAVPSKKAAPATQAAESQAASEQAALAKAAEAVESLYGADVKRAAATGDVKDGLALASRILQAARKATAQPQLAALLCEKAYDLAAGRPEGEQIVLDAIEVEAGVMPERAVTCALRNVEIRQKTYQSLSGAEKADAGECLLDALVTACDAQAKAHAYAEAGAYCQRAAALALTVAPGQKDALEARVGRLDAAAVLARQAKDPDPAKAKLAGKQLAEAIAALGPTPRLPAAGLWIDLIPLVDPQRDAAKGEWKRQDGALSVGSEAAARIAIPLVPEGGYELQVTFLRESGKQGIAIVLPAGAGRVALTLAAFTGRVHGLEMVDGKNPLENPTGVKPAEIENGREYPVDVKVRLDKDQARIEVAFNGQPLLKWEGAQSALTPGSSWDLPQAGCPGLGAWQAPTVFKVVRLRMLSGQAKPLPPPTTAPAAGSSIIVPSP